MLLVPPQAKREAREAERAAAKAKNLQVMELCAHGTVVSDWKWPAGGHKIVCV